MMMSFICSCRNKNWSRGPRRCCLLVTHLVSVAGCRYNVSVAGCRLGVSQGGFSVGRDWWGGERIVGEVPRINIGTLSNNMRPLRRRIHVSYGCAEHCGRGTPHQHWHMGSV